MDKQIEENADFIAQLIIKSQDDEIKLLEAQLDQAVAALKEARDAIKELPADILGETGDAWNTWFIKEELMDSIYNAIDAVEKNNEH